MIPWTFTKFWNNCIQSEWIGMKIYDEVIWLYKSEVMWWLSLIVRKSLLENQLSIFSSLHFKPFLGACPDHAEVQDHPQAGDGGKPAPECWGFQCVWSLSCSMALLKSLDVPVGPEVKYLGKGEGPGSSKAWGQFSASQERASSHLGSISSWKVFFLFYFGYSI